MAKLFAIFAVIGLLAGCAGAGDALENQDRKEQSQGVGR